MECKFMVKKWPFVMILLLIIVVGSMLLQVSNGCVEDERMSLLDIKAFFLSFNNNNNNNNTFKFRSNSFPSWVGPNCCNWERVICNSTSGGHVVELLLNYLLDDDDNLLNVSLFSNFKQLKTLDLSGNSFSGFTKNQGFNQISSFNKLETLDLSYNHFGNEIFSFLSGITSLKKLLLRRSNLEGSIILTGLINLRELDLSFNNLNGTLQMQGLDEYSGLENLNLGYNDFKSSIFSSLKRFISLKVLDLNNNDMEGTFPMQDAANLKNLEFLDLSYNRYYDGVISLQDLKNLKTLNLTRNGFNGSISIQGLDEYSRLENLNLGYNNLKSSVFSSLRRFISLKVLDLNNNDMEGTLPMKDVANLKNLEFLDLSYNRYYDGVISLQDLKNLKTLNLRRNGFNGSIPIQGFCETNHLVELNIGQNYISDQLSECVGNFTRLKVLDIISNRFSGKIPKSIFNLTSIEKLDLGKNYFEGSFSLSLLANHSKLKYLRLPENNHGRFQVETEEPRKWHPTFQLEFLILRDCNLNIQTLSMIPTFLASQHELEYIDFAHNQLVGTFPVWLLHNNSKLGHLDLSDNSFTGLFQLPTGKHNLHCLQISGNKFIGQLPKDTGIFLPSLNYLNLSRNGFEGNLPSSMQQMTWLYWLDVSNNKFYGNLQTSIFNGMFRLKTLFLANNNFNGSIEEYGFINQLSYLDISNNMISGKIPIWIGSLKFLQYIQMSKNLFTGELPKEICSFDKLIYLDVSQNQLTGGVPSCFNLSSLEYLYMQQNNLSGSIPPALLSTASSLKVFDLSFNHFSGHIPNWINKFTSLRVLLLKENKLHGPIPLQLCQVGEISIMDLSNNELIGSIPSCLSDITFGVTETDNTLTSDSGSFMSFGFASDDFEVDLLSILVVAVNFTTKYRNERYKSYILDHMSGLDLSNNKLTGQIPEQIGDLGQIHALNFSHNKLVGHIPKGFSNLKQLESLDLSNNLLSGNIPLELAGLDSLGTFNVSYNNLSGMIPTSPQFSSYPESSYYGNPHLCGLYIQHKCEGSILPPSPQPVNLEEEVHVVFIDIETFFWSFGASYIVILLGFVAVLYINPQWRQRWFYLIEDCYYYVCKCIS